MKTLDEQIDARIAELEATREAIIRAAERQVLAINGGIAELQRIKAQQQAEPSDEA